MKPCSQWQVCLLGKIDTIFFIGKGHWSISVPTMSMCLLPGWMLEKDGRDERQRREEVARRGGRTADVIRCDPVYEATRFLCAKRDKHDAISLGVQSQEMSLVYHTSFPHPPCYSVAPVFSIWLAPTANEVSSVPFASLRESMARALRRAVKTAT